MIHSLFPTPIIEINTPENLKDTFSNMFKDALDDHFQDTTNSTISKQTLSNLHHDKRLYKFFVWLDMKIREGIKELGYSVDVIEFRDCWANKMLKNEYVNSHNHSNSWLSGVYYPFEIEDISSGITFFDPRPANTTMIFPGAGSKGDFTAQDKTFEPKQGTIYVFPSWLWHSVRPVIKDERISVSFNIVPGGGL